MPSMLKHAALNGLKKRYPAQHEFYDSFNKIELITNEYLEIRKGTLYAQSKMAFFVHTIRKMFGFFEKRLYRLLLML